MADDLSQLWSRIEALERAVSTLIEVQQRQVAAAKTTSLTQELRTQLAEVKASLNDLPPHSTKPAEINVGCINVVEADGTLRMIISNHDRAPNIVVSGREIPGRKGGNAAGIIFYNNEGDECGGLCYGSKQMPDGSTQAFASMTFDRYKQDQVMGIQFGEDQGEVTSSLNIWDQPTMPIDQYLEHLQPIIDMPRGPEQDAKFAELRRNGMLWSQRVFVGSYKGDAAIRLHDSQSRPRIRLFTEADGRAGLEFLDEVGAVTHRWPQ